MQVYNALTALRGEKSTSIALGFFDGVHIGHRAVIDAAVGYARQQGLEPAVFTFELPLKNAIKGGRICTEESKRREIEALGAEHYLAPPFEEFCGLEPEDFVHKVLAGLCRAKAVFCGSNFTFGKKAAGDVALLKELCGPLGIRVFEVPMTIWRNAPVSSTRIRAALAAGDIPSVNAMLGRPYQIEFSVQHGQGLGKTLGIPTINQVFPAGYATPKEGVYITLAMVAPGLWLPSATGFGSRPTVNRDGSILTCETFIARYEGDLYGECPQVRFYEYLAPTQKFENLDGLIGCVQNAAEKSIAYHRSQGRA